MNSRSMIFMGVILVLVVLVNIRLTAGADTYNACFPKVALISQDPIPAIPGSYVKVVFEISDISNKECGNGLAVKLKLNYPFSLDPGKDSIQTLEGIPYAQGYKPIWTVPYKIRVADDALEGDYNLTLAYHIGDPTNFESSYTETDFNIAITDVQTNFDAVIQDVSESEVSIAIANTGKYTANSVIVRIPEQDEFRVSGTDGQMVGNLESGDYTLVGFTILPSGMPKDFQNISKENDPSNLKFNIYYTDNIGERRKVSMELPLTMTAGNVSMAGAGNFIGGNGRRTSSSGFNWRTLLIIIGVLIVISVLCIVLKKRGLLSKKKFQNGLGKIPPWMNNAKEKDKKR
jgi:hypothetical protein